MIAGLIYTFTLYSQGFWPLDEEVSLTNLTICSGISEDNNQLLSQDLVTRSEGEQYVCGFINSRSKSRIFFLWYKNDFEHYSLSSYLDTGYFVYPIYIKSADPIGTYYVEVFQGRKKLGTLYYEIDRTTVRKVKTE